MPVNLTKKKILEWSDVLYNPDHDLINDISANWIKYKEIFITKVAGYLYEDMRRAAFLIKKEYSLKKEFDDLTEDEKKVWYDYASGIPGKLKSLGLFIHPYRNFCRTCIITDREIDDMVAHDHSVYSRDVSFLIPAQLKKIGYEIIRPVEASEIDLSMVKKLAKAMHARYLKKMRTSGSSPDVGNGTSGIYYLPDQASQNLTDFENLPDEIKFSNIDNAYHIPTKLLSIGYKIRHVQKGFRPVTLRLNEDEIETMARVEHMRWSWDKRLHGWLHSSVKDSSNKTHPGLVPYEQLPESEREKDRELVRLIPALLQDIDYEASPVNPERIRKLSYAIKPQSSIYKILYETREMNDQIRRMASMSPELEEMVSIRNRKIEEAIAEVRESYNYAQHIQETYLPDDLFVRECFPDSFVLYKPKDIVSGDFYFFSRSGDKIIFAAVDCTGHGIPGALLSTICYGILDQAVNEIKLAETPEILNHLYSKIHRFLRRDEEISGISDDMDVVLCILEVKTNTLTYSGVKNPLYVLRKDDLLEYRPYNQSDEFDENGEFIFSSEKIKLNAGDTLYLCSDGYADQFGGKNHKRYQSSRFKCFLQSIREYSMAEQSDRLYEEIEQWRDENNEDQTDDILVIGIRI